MDHTGKEAEAERGPGTKPPWPARDGSPGGHRGVVLAPQPRGVAGRKESHRTLPVPGERLPRPGLLSAVVPTASGPAVAAAYPVLRSSEPEVRAARALWGGERAGGSLSALHYGAWRVDSNLGVGEVLRGWGADARERAGDFLLPPSARGGCSRGPRPPLIASRVPGGLGVGEGQ